jgi:uncharacterized membrane protein YfcA
MDVPPGAFKILLAVALVFATVRLFKPVNGQKQTSQPPIWAVLAAGISIGFFSGLIGVGGGIFLTPLLLICGWADVKTAAAVSAPFIFVNSAAGLFGYPDVAGNLISSWHLYAIAVVAGGFVGARWGSGLGKPVHMRPILALVLVLAAAKLVLA